MKANNVLLIDDSSSFHKIGIEPSIEIKNVTVSFKSKGKGGEPALSLLLVADTLIMNRKEFLTSI